MEERFHEGGTGYGFQGLLYSFSRDTSRGVVNDYTDGDDYWPSSPMAGPEPDQHGLDGTTSGDQHYWGVWHGFRPLESFDEVTTRFVVNTGFSPSRK